MHKIERVVNILENSVGYTLAAMDVGITRGKRIGGDLQIAIATRTGLITREDMRHLQKSVPVFIEGGALSIFDREEQVERVVDEVGRVAECNGSPLFVYAAMELLWDGAMRFARARRDRYGLRVYINVRQLIRGNRRDFISNR